MQIRVELNQGGSDSMSMLKAGYAVPSNKKKSLWLRMSFNFRLPHGEESIEKMTQEQQSNPILSDKNLFMRIWTSPRQVLRYIHENQYNRFTNVLLVLSGISNAFGQASLKGMGDRQSLEMILAVCIIAGGLFGWMTYYIYAALISWTGSWLGAKGNTRSVIRILAYAMLPSVVSLLFLIPQIWVYGIEVFRSEGEMTSAGFASNTVVYASMLVEFGLVVCTLIFCVIGISEVRKLSIGKSILNLLLPAIIVVVSVILILSVGQLG